MVALPPSRCLCGCKRRSAEENPSFCSNKSGFTVPDPNSSRTTHKYKLFGLFPSVTHPLFPVDLHLDVRLPLRGRKGGGVRRGYSPPSPSAWGGVSLGSVADPNLNRATKDRHEDGEPGSEATRHFTVLLST